MAAAIAPINPSTSVFAICHAGLALQSSETHDQLWIFQSRNSANVAGFLEPLRLLFADVNHWFGTAVDRIDGNSVSVA